MTKPKPASITSRVTPKPTHITEAQEGEIYRVLSDSCECNKINTVKLFEVINQQLQTAYSLGEAKGIEQGRDEEREKNKIDWDIDVRYESDVIEAFNKFIRKWCGSNFAHLSDSDEQDGEFMREKIREINQ